MSKTLARDCPECGTERDFFRAANTEVHIGEKVKWHCPECDHGFVTIDETVDTSVTA